MRCFGKQKPVTPHAQRLLVAHAKAVKQEKKAEKEKNSEKHKGKRHSSKVAEGAGAKTEEKKTRTNKNTSPKDSKVTGAGAETVPKTKTKTPYALAKDKFMDTFPASTQRRLYPYAKIV